MKTAIHKIKKAPHLYISAVVLLLSFYFNLFGVGLYPGWFNGFENWSENYVTSTVECELKGKYPGGLVESTLNQGIPEERCQRYTSQLGLQGYVFAYSLGNIQSQALRSVVFTLFQVLSVLGVILLILCFVHFLKNAYGAKVAVLVAVFFSLSPWLVGFSDNLYWLLFFILLPFVYTLIFYPLLRNSLKTRLIFFLGLCVCFTLKLANGYEYVSTIILASIATIVYLDIRFSNSIKTILKNALLVGLMGVIAFVGVISIQTLSLKNDYGSIPAAVNAIKNRGEYRASGPSHFFPQVITNFKGTVPVAYETLSHYITLDSLQDGKSNFIVYTGILIVNYLLLPVVQFPVEIKGMLGVFIQSFVVWLLLAIGALQIMKRKKRLPIVEYRALTWAIIIGSAGVVSWFILASGHAYEHAHINAILYYISLMPWVYTAIALLISTTYTTWRQKNK